MHPTDTVANLLREAWAFRRRGDYANAKLKVGLAHAACAPEDHLHLGRIFHIYRQIECDHNNLEKALESSGQSLFHYERSGNPGRIAHAKRHLADLQMRMERFADAEYNYREALSMYRQIDGLNTLDMANALLAYGKLLKRVGKIEDAKIAWRESLTHYLAIGLDPGVKETKALLQS